MLKRKFRIQKYISILKNKKKYKQQAIKNHELLKNKLVEEEIVKKEQNQIIPQQDFSSMQDEESQPCWVDEDDEKQIDHAHNNLRKKIKKLPKTNKEYQKSIKKLYTQKFDKFNWAQSGQVLEEKDVNDYMNQELFYDNIQEQSKKVQHFSRTHFKHDSVVTGVDWKSNVLFTTGLDHKLKIWSIHHEENPQLKVQLEKDIYLDDLPITTCDYRNGQIVMGTLRKNIAFVDVQKWKPKFITSSFLADFHNYEHLRTSKTNSYIGLFNKMKVSILDKNNLYCGSLLANQPLSDLQFSSHNPNVLYGVSTDTIYEWDLRKFAISKLSKKYLGFTSLTTSSDSLIVGSKLGKTYIYGNSSFQEIGQNSNLVTHVTHLSSNKKGTTVLGLSKWKTNAARIMDSVTGKSFGNWPHPKTKIGFPTKGAFAENEMFAVGSSQGYINIFNWAS